MRLDDEEGFPWTASTHIGWMLLVLVLSFGFALFALGLYLSVWIARKGRSTLPFLAFALSAVLALTEYPIDRWFPNSQADSVIGLAATIILIVASFLLRREIQTYFQEIQGWQPIINPILTFFFSAVYINYCLVPDRIPVPSPVTSLNISSSTNSAKIDT